MYCLESRMLNEAKEEVIKYQQRLKRKKKEEEENKSSFLYLTYH